MGILEKISEIEKEINRTQKNKGKIIFTFRIDINIYYSLNIFIIYIYVYIQYYLNLCLATEYHLGLLKAKLAKYRAQLLEPSKKQEKGEGFDVLKSGDARVALIGFPSVGKVCIIVVSLTSFSTPSILKQLMYFNIKGFKINVLYLFIVLYYIRYSSFKLN